jgi:flagellar protein FliL
MDGRINQEVKSMPAENEKDKKEETPTPPKKGKGMLIGIIAVVLIGLGAGGFFFLKGKSSASHEGEGAAQEASNHGGGHGVDAEKGAASAVFNLEPFIVNLQDNSGTRYLKLTINLELEPNGTVTELQSQTAQIRDSLIILLSSKGYADIGTVEGKYQMRDEIVARVNQFLHKSKVKTAYFTEFVIQ